MQRTLKAFWRHAAQTLDLCASTSRSTASLSSMQCRSVDAAAFSGSRNPANPVHVRCFTSSRHAYCTAGPPAAGDPTALEFAEPKALPDPRKIIVAKREHEEAMHKLRKQWATLHQNRVAKWQASDA